MLKLLSIVHEICNAISLRHSPAASQQQSKPYLWQRRRSASASHSAFVCVWIACKFVCIAPFISNCTHYKFNPFQQRMAVHSQSSSNTALQKAWWFMPQIGLTIPHQPPLRPTLPQYGTSYLSLHLFSSRFCFRCFFSISFRLNWFSFIVSSSTSLLLTSLPRFSCSFAALSKTIFNAWSKHCSACYAFLLFCGPPVFANIHSQQWTSYPSSALRVRLLLRAFPTKTLAEFSWNICIISVVCGHCHQFGFVAIKPVRLFAVGKKAKKGLRRWSAGRLLVCLVWGCALSLA